MAGLLTLPTELRNLIWDYLNPDQQCTYGVSAFLRPNFEARYQNPYLNLTLTCHQLNTELTPLLYQSVILECFSPGDFLHWVAQTGIGRSSMIASLVLKTRSLPSAGKHVSELYETAWGFALLSLPKLRALTVHFEYEDNLPAAITESPPVETPQLLQRLSELALQSCETESDQEAALPSPMWSYRPSMEARPYTHGVFALNERMPLVLNYHWNKSTRFTRNTARFPTTEVFTHESMEENLTGLEPHFFERNSLCLTNTCAFSENNEYPNVHLTFTRQPKQRIPAIDYINVMLQRLPTLQYLRIGSCELDSSFLREIPTNVNTLDVAFTDNEPRRIAENIIAMRLRLWNLFTLAIEVSPLHDRKPADEDDTAEHFFDRIFVSNDVQERWAPFWKALDDVKASRVKVWEGEGPGFRRIPKRINREYIGS